MDGPGERWWLQACDISAATERPRHAVVTLEGRLDSRLLPGLLFLLGGEQWN